MCGANHFCRIYISVINCIICVISVTVRDLAKQSESANDRFVAGCN